jgi:nitrogen fixation/metabolism regulation signal transduction histidine kinase
MKPVGRIGPEERAVGVLVLAAAVPAALTAGLVWWTAGSWAATAGVLAGLVVLLAAAARSSAARVAHPLRSLASVVAALRQGDFSVTSPHASGTGALGELAREINGLSRLFRDQRLGAVETTALLETIVDEIDVAVFVFGEGARLRLVNRVGARLLDAPAQALVGRSAQSLGLGSLLAGENRVLELDLPAAKGPWELRGAWLRASGQRHRLVVLTDLSRALRREERDAWQRLLRVLGHEINNSLSPIKSLAGSLRELVARETGLEAKADLVRGLEIIEHRAESLTRFMEAYARLARLPPPRRGRVDVGPWIERVVALEPRMKITLVQGEPVVLEADSDQLDQLLINLVRNAVDAALETGGGVRVKWLRNPRYVEVVVEDEGRGVLDSSNLFVPFFTTKPGGSGIGLALGRRIAEGHDGHLTLVNRLGGPGCEARLWLPRATATHE